MAFHYSLLLDRAGIWVVGAAALVMLAALATGLVIHRRIFRDFFTFRPGPPAPRSWLDAHNVTGVLVLPFHVMITYTGLMLFYAFYMPAGIHALYAGDSRAYFTDLVPRVERKAAKTAAPLLPLRQLVATAEAHLGAGAGASIAVQNPGDAHAVVNVFRRRDDRLARVSDAVTLDGATGAVLDVRVSYRATYLTERVLAGLHFAQFGGYPLRWLYFAAGLASSAMIATGLVLFVVRRRGAPSQRGAGFSAALSRAVEGLNVAVVAGLCVACAAYLWANRLIPADAAQRGDREVAAFFGVWLVCLGHGFLRGSARRAWIEQLSLAALLSVGLPVLNWLTTESHVAATLERGQWLVAGVDLTVLGLGAALGAAARIVGRPLRARANSGAAPAGAGDA